MRNTFLNITNLTGLLVLLLLNQCTTDKKYTVNGRIIEPFLGASVENAQIYLYYSELSGGVYSTGYKLILETTSDSEGKFKCEFDDVSAVEFKLRAEKEGFFSRDFLFQRGDWQLNENNEEVLELYGLSELEVKFANFSTQSKFLFQLSEHSPECTNCCSSDSYIVEAGNNDDKVCNVYSNQNIGFEYINIFLGEGSKKTGSIFIEPGLNVLEIDAN